MKSNFRLLATCLLTLGCAVIVVPGMAAGSYPDHPIRLIVTSAPGSGLDLVARAIGPDLGAALKQSIVVENKAGAAGIPGTRDIVASKADGYTLGLVSSNHAINPSAHVSLPYDTIKDITPVTIIGTVPVVLTVPKSSPFRTLRDLLAAAKAKPGAINFGSSGPGSALDIAGLMLEKKAHIKLMHIPYRGGNALTTDLMSGQVQTAFLAISTAEAQIKAGTIRALAVSTLERLPSLPNVPTLNESGVAGYHYVPWIGLIGPAGLPASITKLLQAKVHQVIGLKKVKAQFAVQGFNPSGTSPQEFLTTLKSEMASTQELMGNPGLARNDGQARTDARANKQAAR
ncbi:Bug family tripartite tricarboxylate transporter substrate binding protein [Paralcaligenes ureilyticus]|uniref:Tripartite-type tricarboxylate transporter receptor subunit TctC n=1 Tax=Paralcaligenes ureilyticus TaxID=627131 RepID=A0A4R3LUS3_9BURK|nr:tripartite tricarboxylate transporter substrate binding protein [Paralcaligenes ureilyticus]TCT03399.1 tripartite-type tricarboxylate transporter receptor subunit TctC [Paralcaligenes ureilyticus]